MNKVSEPLRALFDGFEGITETRKARGRQYTVDAVLKLVTVCLLCGQLHPTAMAQFAKSNSRWLWRGLGFKKQKMPARHSIARILADVSVEELSNVILNWMAVIVRQYGAKKSLSEFKVSVDGKCSRSSEGDDGHPLMMLNVFLHDVELTVASWQIETKDAETTELRARIKELLAAIPALQVFVGDAHFANRPLCEAIATERRDYLFKVKGNQPSVQEVLKVSFDEIAKRPAGKTSTEKKGLL